MTRVLPDDAVAILAGRHEAGQIEAAINAAYWLHGRDNDTALYLLNEAHLRFAEMALAMGYTITPVAARTRDDQAATGPRIVTGCHDFGPWPVWEAWDDRLGADASPVGRGATEAEAIEDFRRQIEEAA